MPVGRVSHAVAANQMTGPAAESGAVESLAGRDASSTPASWQERLTGAIRRRGAWIRVAISAGLITALLQQTSIAEIGAALGQTLDRWPLVLIAACLPGVGILIAAARWKVLLGGVGVRTPTLALICAMLVGSFFNYFLPSTIGGDVVRSWWIQRTLGSRTISLTIVGLDRLIGLIGICAVGLVAVSFQPGLVRGLPHVWAVPLLIGFAGISVMALGNFLITGAGRKFLSFQLLSVVRDKVAIVHDGLRSLRRSKGRLAAAFGLSIALQSLIIFHFILLSAAAGIEVSSWGLAILIPVVTLVTLLPVTINGIGLREASLAFLGATFGLTTGDAVVLAWLFLAFQFSYVLAGGLIYMYGRSRSQC